LVLVQTDLKGAYIDNTSLESDKRQAFENASSQIIQATTDTLANSKGSGIYVRKIKIETSTTA